MRKFNLSKNDEIFMRKLEQIRRQNLWPACFTKDQVKQCNLLHWLVFGDYNTFIIEMEMDITHLSSHPLIYYNSLEQYIKYIRQNSIEFDLEIESK